MPKPPAAVPQIVHAIPLGWTVVTSTQGARGVANAW
jgi:hypothetical protein